MKGQPHRHFLEQCFDHKLRNLAGEMSWAAPAWLTDQESCSAAITAIIEAVAAYTEEDGSVEEQQDQVEAEQEREGTIGDGGRFPPSRQPEAPISTSTVRILESSLVSARQSPKVVQVYHARTQTTSPIMFPAREVARTESGSCISIQDITFLRVEGQREAAGGPEYQFVTKI